ncbi:hypothetical protein A2943_03240 [Candidatus Adlerbacteria bacterium RIFCSPLOWO2_01_FULL_51_16]|uniref:Uncharacterized protein n=1 Tax=Candidatus Adlerbacteria bacterium RIFCSPLOWO2_01_FULL_51_16 TaxID=1797243 RepID=A0A1F4XG49_9BACT|nr:MAG: hypothetical protein A2943_03240 [Candidatus Adlerbacteria bacterium RIFCSPLOWO2_01_FULL_51_16]
MEGLALRATRDQMPAWHVGARAVLVSWVVTARAGYRRSEGRGGECRRRAPKLILYKLSPTDADAGRAAQTLEGVG